MNGSDKLDEISSAMVAALATVKNPKPDTSGQVRGKANYRYLSLPALCEHVREAFKGVGLAFSQEVVSDSSGVGVITRIMHQSGQWLESGPLMLSATGGPQDVGSAITYARRYALAAAVGLAADEDDDGAKAARPTSAGDAFQEAKPRSQQSGAAPISGGMSDGAPDPSTPVEAGTEAGDSGAALPEEGGSAPEGEDGSPSDPANPEQMERAASVYGSAGLVKMAYHDAFGYAMRRPLASEIEKLILDKAGASA